MQPWHLGARPVRHHWHVLTRWASSKALAPATQLLQHHLPQDGYAAAASPLYQTATFVNLNHADALYDYTRSGNPTRHLVEQAVAQLEGADRAFAFTSGMAALTAVLRTVSQPGSHVIASADLYGGTHRLLRHAARHAGLTVDFVDLTQIDAVASAFRPDTTAVFAESPTNPLMQVVDLQALADLCRARNVRLCVDNSLLSPVLMQPHNLGADLVVNSATKFLNGHSDTMAGFVSARDPALCERLAFVQNAEGAGLAPFDAWLVQRGLKTLFQRQQLAQANATVLARFLRGHPLVEQVHYLDRADVHHSPQAQTHFNQASGGGAVLSFLPRGPDATAIARRLLDAVRLFKISVSFGSVHSQLEMPALHSHASIPEEERHLPAALLRVSVGTEDVNDLMADMDQALTRAAQPSPPKLQAYPLGSPLPANEPELACTASMPHWQNVIDYEEGDPRVVEALHCGYPRFVYPPAVRRLITALGARYAGPQQTVLPCPSLHTALRVQQHLLAAGIPPQALSIQDVGFEGVAAVVMPDTAAAAARTYWQHMGEIVSARLAQRVLGHLDGGRAWDPLPTSPATDPSHHLRRHIAALSQQDPDHIQLFSTGMGAVTACTRMLRRAAAGTNRAAAKAVVLGFPYVDTLKQLQHPHLGPGAHFLPGGDLDQLRALAAREPLLAIYVETPSNPLLRTVDMDALRAIADAAEVPVVVDDSIANYCNVDVLTPGLADVQVSSLTKSFSGRGNVMGGAMILNPRSAHFSVLQYHANCSPEPGLYRADAEALLHNSVNLEARTARTNASAERLADFLIDHPAVAAVHYPKFVTPEFYERIRRPTATGYGGLMSIDLRQPARAAAVHDALVLPKGPGFGTNFSLLCPYTLLAHYYELDFARTHGVEKSLLRMWVGLEDPDQLIDTWAHALTKAD